METKKLDTQYLTFEINNGILYATYKEGLNVTLSIAQEMLKSRMQFIGDRSYPILIISHGVVSADKEARDYMSSAEGIKGLLAGAFLINSVFSKFLINFYLTITTPKIPSRVFTDKARALKWLEQYKVQ